MFLTPKSLLVIKYFIELYNICSTQFCCAEFFASFTSEVHRRACSSSCKVVQLYNLNKNWNCMTKFSEVFPSIQFNRNSISMWMHHARQENKQYLTGTVWLVNFKFKFHVWKKCTVLIYTGSQIMTKIRNFIRSCSWKT